MHPTETDKQAKLWGLMHTFNYAKILVAYYNNELLPLWKLYP